MLVVKGLNLEAQPVGTAPLPGILALLGSGLPICGLQSLSSLLFTCLNCGLWRKVNSNRPFHSFGSLGQAFASVKKFSSWTVTVDPSFHFLYISLLPVNRGTYLAKSWRL